MSVFGLSGQKRGYLWSKDKKEYIYKPNYSRETMSNMDQAQKKKVQRLKVEEKKQRASFDEAIHKVGSYDDALALGSDGIQAFIDTLKSLLKTSKKIDAAIDEKILTEEDLSSPTVVPVVIPVAVPVAVSEQPTFNPRLFEVVSELYEGRKGVLFKYRYESKGRFRAKILEDPEVLKAVMNVKSVRTTIDRVHASIDLSEYDPTEKDIAKSALGSTISAGESAIVIQRLRAEVDKLTAKVERSCDSAFNGVIDAVIAKRKKTKKPSVAMLTLDQLNAGIEQLSGVITALKPKGASVSDLIVYGQELSHAQGKLRSYTAHRDNYGCGEAIKREMAAMRAEVIEIMYEDEDEWLPEEMTDKVEFEHIANAAFVKAQHPVEEVKMSADEKEEAKKGIRSDIKRMGGWAENEELTAESLVKTLARSKASSVAGFCASAPSDMIQIVKQHKRKYIDKRDAAAERAL